VATRGTLNRLDPTALDDQHLTVFNEHRSTIEDTASEKFDSEGPNPDNGHMKVSRF
jgi:hypothetical protein